MASSAQDIRWRRLLATKDTITCLETRRTNVQAALENAQHAYNAALAVVRELEAELSDINEEHRSATNRFTAVRDAYRREAVTRLPDDIVRHLFEHARPFRGNADFMDMQLGCFGNPTQKWEDVMLPFALASVCRQWRSVALGLSSVWSLVLVRKTTRAHLERIRLLLERSKSTPLDIFFDPGEGSSEICEAMLSALQEHTWRWNRIQQTRVALPNDFALVRRQAPQLRGLFISVDSAFVDIAAAGPQHHTFWLGPQIEQLVLISPACHFVPKAPYVLPSLVTLLWSHPGTHILWEIIHTARDTLRDVVFAPVTDAAEVLPPQKFPRPFTLRNLEQLHIHTLVSGAQSQFNILKAPRLKALSIQHKAQAIMVAPFLEAVNATVTTLVIHSELGRDAVAPFSKLSNVEHLLFSRATAIFTLVYNVSDAFFADLSAPVDHPGAESPVWIWPKLSTITLSARGTFEAGTGQNFLQLVRTRTGAELDDRSTPRRLTRVVIEDKASPAWVRDEVRLILE